jgi:DnaJ-class molecular chaperone
MIIDRHNNVRVNKIFTGYAYYVMQLFLLFVSLLYVDVVTSRTIPNNYNNMESTSTTFDPYRVLGFDSNQSSDITSKQIKQRYHALCLKYHPDKNYNSRLSKIHKQYEIKFKQVQKAYELIGNERSRQQYDFLSKRQQHQPSYSFEHRSSSSNPSYRQRRNNGNDDTQSSSGSYDNDDLYQEMLRRMFEQQQQRTRSSSSFFTNPNNFFTDPFYQTSSNPIFSHNKNNNAGSLSSLKSIYVFKVYVPLQDLYRGVNQYKMTIPTNNNDRNASNNMFWMHHNFFYHLWKRYAAAFRGGIGYILLYQSLLYSIPFYRFSKTIALLIAFYFLDRSIPALHDLREENDSTDHPTSHNDGSYYVNILPGYKGGTKFTFKQQQKNKYTTNQNHDVPSLFYNGNRPPTIDIIFQICEAHHHQYKRIGNHLYTSIYITPQQAKDGCVVPIDSLISSSSWNHEDDDEKEKDTINVKIPSNTKSGDQIRLSGYGWPIRKTTTRRYNNINNPSSVKQKYGDLIVTVHLSKMMYPWKRRFFSG